MAPNLPDYSFFIFSMASVFLEVMSFECPFGASASVFLRLRVPGVIRIIGLGFEVKTSQ